MKKKTKKIETSKKSIKKQKLISKEEITDILTDKQKLFVELMLCDKECFGNASKSYRVAYNLTPAQFKAAGVSAHYNLKNPKILAYRDLLLKEWFDDGVIDNELAKLARQDKDLVSKNMAIKEINRLKNRVIERVDHTTLGKEVTSINYIRPDGNNAKAVDQTG